MRNLLGILGLAVKTVGPWLLLAVLGTLMTIDASRAETLPSAESILDEAIELVVPSPKASDADSLLEIAVRQAKVRSCDKAKDLFQKARALSEKWAKNLDGSVDIRAQIGFLGRLIAAQRRAGCVEGLKHNEERLLGLYQEQNRKHLEGDGGDELATGLHNLQLQIDLGDHYLSMGDLDAAHDMADKIIQQIRQAKWRPSIEFESAAVLLAQLERDKEAFEVVNRYERFFEARPEITKDPANRHYWIFRVSNMAAVAEAQAEAGHTEEARATLQRAIEKARSTPVARLNEVYGEKETHVEGQSGFHQIGEGEALQSAALMNAVWHAVRMGEVGIALEVFELVSPLANEAGATGILIQVLAQKGEVAIAQKLLDRLQCRSGVIAQGLLDGHNWAGAIKAYEAYQKSSCCKRECNFAQYVSFTDIGKARTFVQGPASALEWARKQSQTQKVYASLGIVDALLEEEQKAIPR